MRGGQAVEWQSGKAGVASRMSDGELMADRVMLEKAEQAGWHIGWVLDLTHRNASEKTKEKVTAEEKYQVITFVKQR